MAKKQAKRKGQKRTPSTRKAGARKRAAARRGTGRRRSAGAKAGVRKGAAGVRKGAAGVRKGAAGVRKGAAGVRKGAAGVRKSAARCEGGAEGCQARAKRPVRKSTRRPGGTGREQELAQTPETGRTVRGRTNPMPTKRSTGTPAGAGSSRRVPALDRARRQLRELDETVPSPPSSLDPVLRHPSAAATGRLKLAEARAEHTETSPALTGGDVDASWEDAYAVGDEAPGGDNPTPDQDRVDDIGKALGVEYQDNEELKGADKIIERDRHRWEYDPASSEDYKDRD